MSSRSFESTEDLIEWFAEQRAIREARVSNISDEQKALAVSDLAVRFFDADTVIFIEIEEADEMMVRGMHYSHLVPDGEYGSTDRAIIWPIDRELFNVARAYLFNPARLPVWEKGTLGGVADTLMAHYVAHQQ